MRFYYFCLLNINIAVHLGYCMIGSASCQALYVGCYKNFSVLSFNKNPIQSVSQCLTQCRSRIFLFAALKDGSSCYCGNITNTRVPSSNCNLPCGDNNGTCGGNNFYAVYTDTTSYRGCFDRYDLLGDMNFEIVIVRSSLSFNKCYERCRLLNYRFCGLYIIRNYEVGCFCGDNYGSYQRGLESECELCFANENFVCGKNDKISIYSVGYFPGLNKSYSEIFHCYGGVTDSNGTCNSTKCKGGWKGAKCNQRDCVMYDGRCDERNCKEFKIGNQVISECVCKEGFQSISIYDECTDIDECQSNPCNEPSETCINTFGSFMCICSPGYNLDYYSYQSDCRDMNECQSNPCNEPSETCINTMGSFMCTCSPGYKYIYQSDSGGRTTIILGVFLALCLCAIIIYTVGMFFYRKKLKDTESRLEKLQKTIKDNGMKSCNSTLQLPNQPQEEHTYAKLKINEIYEN